MKVMKNGNSAFANLFVIVDSIKGDELERCRKFLKEKRKQTKNLQFLDFILGLIEKNQTTATIDESKISKDVEREISDNFQKATQNLTDRILAFLALEFRNDTWKKWQIEDSQKLLEIEALCNRNLFSQAKAMLLKLEDNLRNRSEYHIYYWDDVGIYARMANLKVMLNRLKPDLFNTEETDEIIHNLMKLGDYFYNNKLSKLNEEMSNHYSTIGYRIVAKYFSENQDLEAASNTIEALIQHSRNFNFISDSQKLVWFQYLHLYKTFIALKSNKREQLWHLHVDNQNYEPASLILVNELMMSEIKLSMGIKNHFPYSQEVINEELIQSQFFYTSQRLKEISEHREFNLAIIKYITGQFEDCKQILEPLLLKKHIKNISNPLFLKIQLLKLLCLACLRETDFEASNRTINACLKEQDNVNFEKKAFKLLQKWTSSYSYGNGGRFFDENKDAIEELRDLVDSLEPLHHVVMFTLENRIVSRNV
jgi:hypothetical protein